MDPTVCPTTTTTTTCNVGDCDLQNSTYIDMTTTTLSRRLTMHLTAGGPKIHMKNNHNSTISRENLVQNTNILYYEPDFNTLQIMELTPTRAHSYNQ